MWPLLTSACDLVSLSGESKAARITWKSPMSGKEVYALVLTFGDDGTTVHVCVDLNISLHFKEL